MSDLSQSPESDLPALAVKKSVLSRPDESPILIIGTVRSGTTLLRQMLNAHPRIYLTHEASFYLADGVISKQLSNHRYVDQWLDNYLQTFNPPWAGLDPDQIRAQVPTGLARDRLVEVFRAIMRTKASEYGKPRYGDKTPLHSAHLQRIFEDFPDPRVIHIVRDPRATVASLGRMPWASSCVGLNSRFCDIHFKGISLFRERIHEIRLEDLLADPRTVMGGVLDFVGEEWDEAVLNHTRHCRSEDVPPFPWFQNATRERKRSVSSSGSSAKRTDLTPAWVRIVENDNRYAMETYGYTRTEFAREPGFLAQQRARLSELPAALCFAWRCLRLFMKMRSPEPRKRQEALMMGLHLNPSAWQNYPGFPIPDIKPFHDLRHPLLRIE